MGCDKDLYWFERSQEGSLYPDGVESSLVLSRCLNRLGEGETHLSWSDLLNWGRGEGLSSLDVLAGLTRLEYAGRVRLDSSVNGVAVIPLPCA